MTFSAGCCGTTRVKAAEKKASGKKARQPVEKEPVNPPVFRRLMHTLSGRTLIYFAYSYVTVACFPH